MYGPEIFFQDNEIVLRDEAHQHIKSKNYQDWASKYH